MSESDHDLLWYLAATETLSIVDGEFVPMGPGGTRYYKAYESNMRSYWAVTTFLCPGELRDWTYVYPGHLVHLYKLVKSSKWLFQQNYEPDATERSLP